MNEITAFITAVAHATNITKAAIDARDEAKRREALTELSAALADLHARHLSVVQNQLALVEENETLRKKLDTYDQWEQEKTRYSLQKVDGTFVRALDPDKARGEPLHRLCTHCYEDRQKSIIQPFPGYGGGHHICPRCKTEFEF